MLGVYTVFSEKDRSKPLATDISTGLETSVVSLFGSKSGKTIYDINQDVCKIKSVLTSGKEILINNLKDHIIGFGVDNSISDSINAYEILEVDGQRDHNIDSARAKAKKRCQMMVSAKKMDWHKVKAGASKVYAHLEKKGILYNYSPTYPAWDTKLFSGRSRTSGFSIHGASKDDMIANINGDDLYINFDWVAADIRIVSYLSKDKVLLESFEDGDPYSYIAKMLNADSDSDEISRDESKRALLATIYSMDIDNPLLNLFESLRPWMVESLKRFDKDGYLSSVLGRRFRISKDRTKKSVFNAVIQGSVAHAMQNVMYKAWLKYPNKILTENHDSLVVTCKENNSQMRKIIEYVSAIMLRPFDGILEDEMIFPVSISIGKKYKRWKFYKRLQ